MIHVAVVGCGNIAHAHVEGLLTFPERCRIVALCDIYPEKAEAMRQKYGLDCQVYDDHEKMLSSEHSIDLVHVCTPPYVHAEIAINAMNAGCNTVVEKPMATCLAECDSMLEAERRNQVTMACIAQNRFRNSIYKLKRRRTVPWRGGSAARMWIRCGGEVIAIMTCGGAAPGKKREAAPR